MLSRMRTADGKFSFFLYSLRRHCVPECVLKMEISRLLVDEIFDFKNKTLFFEVQRVNDSQRLICELVSIQFRFHVCHTQQHK